MSITDVAVKLSNQHKGFKQRAGKVDAVGIGLDLRLADAKQVNALLVGVRRVDLDLKGFDSEFPQFGDGFFISCP